MKGGGYNEGGYYAYDESANGEYEATLTQMFVVNVIDGRLGMMSLTPVVIFPASPKYITPEPRSFRSGVYTSIGSDGWLPSDEVLKVNSYIPPAEPLIVFPIEFSSTAYSEGGYGAKAYGGGYTSTYGSPETRYQKQAYSMGDDDLLYGRIAIRGSSYHDFLRCDGGYVVSTFLGDRDLGFFPTVTT
uniref:Uncharacterized protein n=2 Tax=Lygus hesperus TaxID=30085 RepID=A0A146LVP3_LYGHE